MIENSLEHDEHEEHEKTEDHDEHEEHADHEEESAHSELFVTYSFNCDDIQQLETINVKLLEIWPGFKDLDVQLIGPNGQSAAELSPEQSAIDIKQVL